MEMEDTEFSVELEEVASSNDESHALTTNTSNNLDLYHPISVHAKSLHIVEHVWNHFEKRLENADVKFHIGTRFVRAHRSVLSATSSFLARLFHEIDPYQSKEELNLSIPDMKYPDLMSILEFVYRGEVMTTRRRIKPLQHWLRILGIHLTMDILDSKDSNREKDVVVVEDVDKDNNNKEEMENRVQLDNFRGLEENIINAVEKDLNVENSEKVILDQQAVVVVPEKDSSTTVIIDDSSPSSKNRKKFKCQVCLKEFQSYNSLKAHRNIHTGAKPFSCSECGKCFRYKDSLVTHNREHTGERIACSFCGKEFKHMRDYRDHKNIHTREKVYVCDVCTLSFSTKKQMFNHKECHKLTPEPCPDCGKKLKNLASYKAHIKNHETFRKFGCDVCGRMFKRGFDLKVHERIHTGAKPHTCDICGKTFALTSTLAKHRRFHTDIFPCSVCGKTFTSTESLAKHMTTLHTEKNPEDVQGQKYIIVDANQLTEMDSTITEQLGEEDVTLSYMDDHTMIVMAEEGNSRKVIT